MLLYHHVKKNKTKKTKLLQGAFGHNAMCRALGQAGRKQISTLALRNEEASSSASGPAVI